MHTFVGRVALVTGAGAGIGAATARRFGDGGAAVILVDIDSDAAQREAELICAAGGNAFAVTTNVSISAEVANAVRAALERLGHIDILVNSAGGFKERRMLVDTSEDEWDMVIDSNLKGTFLFCRAVLPGMLDRGWGRIINVSSDAALGNPHLTAAHYTAAKAGVLGLTRHLAKEVASRGITVNAVAPGITWSPRIRDLYADAETQRHLAADIPAGRFAEPEDQAELILFLASGAARHITGATIPVSGGKVMN